MGDNFDQKMDPLCRLQGLLSFSSQVDWIAQLRFNRHRDDNADIWDNKARPPTEILVTNGIFDRFRSER